MREEPWLLLAAVIAGVTSGILVAVFAKKGNGVAARLARCSIGFMVAIVWIMAIADEVVEVLTVRLTLSIVSLCHHTKLQYMRMIDLWHYLWTLRRHHRNHNLRNG